MGGRFPLDRDSSTIKLTRPYLSSDQKLDICRTAVCTGAAKPPVRCANDSQLGADPANLNKKRAGKVSLGKFSLNTSYLELVQTSKSKVQRTF